MCNLCNFNFFIIHDTSVNEQYDIKPSIDKRMDINDGLDGEQIYSALDGLL